MKGMVMDRQDGKKTEKGMVLSDENEEDIVLLKSIYSPKTIRTDSLLSDMFLYSRFEFIPVFIHWS